MDKIIVGIAEGKVARENQVLISYAPRLLCGDFVSTTAGSA